MTIAIADSPKLVEDERFDSLSVLVPLSEQPSAAWLEHFRTQKELPGIAHSVTDEGLVVHLDRGDFDVMDAIRRIAQAVDKAGPEAEASAEADEKRAIRRASERASKSEKLDTQLKDWWEKRQGSSDALTSG
jgi:hypothetical protein